MLESLAGILKSVRTPTELLSGGLAPPSPELPAVEASVALAMELPPLPGVSREGLGLAFSAALRIEPGPGAEVEASTAREPAPETRSPLGDMGVPGAFPPPQVQRPQAAQSQPQPREGEAIPARPSPAASVAGTPPTILPHPGAQAINTPPIDTPPGNTFPVSKSPGNTSPVGRSPASTSPGSTSPGGTSPISMSGASTSPVDTLPVGAPLAIPPTTPLATAAPLQPIPGPVDGKLPEGLEARSVPVSNPRRLARVDAPPAAPVQGGGAPSPAAAFALALAPGVIAVTGQRLPGQAEAASPPSLEAADGPDDVGSPSLQAPLEAARQAVLLPTGGQVPEARASEARPATPRRREATAAGDVPAALRPEGVGTSPQAEAPVPLPGAPRAEGRVEALQARAGGDTPGSLSDDRDDLAVRIESADPAPTLSGAAPAVETRSRELASPEPAPLPARAGPETVLALATQMARRLDDGVTRFDLQLNPGDLGRVDVRLEIDAAGGIRAAFTFEDAHAAGELGRRADELQKSLESAGFNLSGGLTFDVSGDRSQGRNPGWADARDGRNPAPAAPEREAVREGPSEITEALSGRRMAARSGVDIRI